MCDSNTAISLFFDFLQENLNISGVGDLNKDPFCTHIELLFWGWERFLVYVIIYNMLERIQIQRCAFTTS